MEGSLGGGGGFRILFVFWSGYSISSSGFQPADKYETETKKHPPATTGNLWDILVESKLCMKFVILFVTIKGRYITTI